MSDIIINDFSGGIRGEYGTKRAPNEVSNIENALVQAGNIRPSRGNDVMSTADNAHSTDTMGVFQNHHLYVGANGEEYIIARRGHTLWIGFPDASPWTESTTIDWRPLFGDVWYCNKLKHTARSNISKESFAQVGALLYSASEDPGTNDYLLRWDGFTLTTGKLKYIGVDSEGHGMYESDDPDINFAELGVKAGDILFLKNHSVDVSDGGEWRVGTDDLTYGYIIGGVGIESLPATCGVWETLDGVAYVHYSTPNFDAYVTSCLGSTTWSDDGTNMVIGNDPDGTIYVPAVPRPDPASGVVYPPTEVIPNPDVWTYIPQTGGTLRQYVFSKHELVHDGRLTFATIEATDTAWQWNASATPPQFQTTSKTVITVVSSSANGALLRPSTGVYWVVYCNLGMFRTLTKGTDNFYPTGLSEPSYAEFRLYEFSSLAAAQSFYDKL